MIFSKSDSKPTYQEISDNEDLPVPKYRQRTNIFQYSCIAFLTLAWVITLGLYWQLNLSIRPVPTPIPDEVFNRVKVVFQPDLHYVGPGREAGHYWDRLVAGTYKLHILHISLLTWCFSQATTHSGLKSPRNGAFREASLHRTIILTWATLRKRASTLYLSCISYIAWYVTTPPILLDGHRLTNSTFRTWSACNTGRRERVWTLCLILIRPNG